MLDPRSLALALALAGVAGCSAHGKDAASAPPAPAAPIAKHSAVLRQGGSFDGGGDPAGDSLATLLDKALGRSGMHAAVYGQVISDGVAKDQPDSSSDGSPKVVTDYSFRVDAVFGKGPSVVYSQADTITIRIPGGATATNSVAMEDSPRLSKGDQLVVFDQDQGLIAHDSRTIVLLTPANLGTVSGSSVTFQRGVISFNEARDRLNGHPAKN